VIIGAAGHGELTLTSLGSGSNGNAFVLKFSGTTILIDAGVPIRTLMQQLGVCGIDVRTIDAILLSHEHSDHVRALPSLLKRAKIPVVGTPGTRKSLGIQCTYVDLVPLERQELLSVAITPFPVQHDAPEPVGFFIEAGDVAVTFATDLGAVDEYVADFVYRSDHVVIESNYDEQMLRNGPYPAYLKKRIRSNLGHLSNDDCAAFLCDTVNERSRSIWLAHLSEKNNAPDVALDASTKQLRARGVQSEITALPRYGSGIVEWRSSNMREITRQASLPFTS
jgi:phosphoribosyl 1,2-cyclic phosphodiesterase